MIFEPVEDFESPETRSAYVKGMRYTVRPENAVLAALVVEEWVPSGKVQIVGGAPDAALRTTSLAAADGRVAGRGTVS